VLTVEGQTHAVRSGETSVEALVRAGLSRAAVDPFGAWEALDEDAVRAARVLDDRLASGAADELVLAGVTVGVKDLFAVSGLPRRAGSRVTDQTPSAADADAVRRLRDLGATILGTTTMPEFAFGPTPGARNPHAPDHTPGSSSAGSAIAVAAGDVPVTLATQTNGSIVRPAAFCGVAALKPTQGAMPHAGLPRLVPTLDQPGLMAADVASLAAVWVAWDDAPCPLAPPRPHVALVRTSRWDHCEPGTRAVVEEVAGLLGADVLEVPARFDDAWEWMETIIAVELARNLASYASRFDELSVPIQQAVRAGEAMSVSRYADALAGRESLREWAIERLGNLDAVLTPCAPGPAPRLEDGAGSPEFCTLWSLVGAPSLALPAATAGPLPLGVQLVAAPGRDRDLLSLARDLERHLRPTRTPTPEERH
jgi:Asp-tRNA(Asn)/Glu-tRNA(Gln) amidotransferase A subunit family amidase